MEWGSTDWSGHACQSPVWLNKPRVGGRSGRRALGCTTTAPGLTPGTLPRRRPGSSGYFLAMNVYLPSSPLVGSSQVTVHLPSELNLAFTLPFLVS